MLLIPPRPWTASGACLNVNPDLFFPAQGESTGPAKAVCAGCEVRQSCLEYALEQREVYGIWGGLSERERRTLRRDRQAGKVAASVLPDVVADEAVKPGRGRVRPDLTAAKPKAKRPAPSVHVEQPWKAVQLVARPTLPGLGGPDGRTVRRCPVCGQGFLNLRQHQRGGHHQLERQAS